MKSLNWSFLFLNESWSPAYHIVPIPSLWYSSFKWTSHFSLFVVGQYSICSTIGGMQLNCLQTENASPICTWFHLDVPQYSIRLLLIKIFIVLTISSVGHMPSSRFIKTKSMYSSLRRFNDALTASIKYFRFNAISRMMKRA